MKTADALKIGMALGRISRTLDAWEESKHKREDNGQFTSGGGSASGKPKITTTKGGVQSVSRGGRGGQYHILRNGSKSYISIQSSKKDGSWGKPRQLQLISKEEIENPEKAIERMNKNNPGTKFRFDPDSME